MDWVCIGLFFITAGMLVWNFYLKNQLDQRNGWEERTLQDIDWVKTNCPEEWAKIAATMMRNQ